MLRSLVVVLKRFLWISLTWNHFRKTNCGIFSLSSDAISLYAISWSCYLLFSTYDDDDVLARRLFIIFQCTLVSWICQTIFNWNAKLVNNIKHEIAFVLYALILQKQVFIGDAKLSLETVFGNSANIATGQVSWSRTFWKEKSLTWAWLLTGRQIIGFQQFVILSYASGT